MSRRHQRPQWIEVETIGGKVRVNVQVHDAACRAEYRRLRARLLEGHPDKGGSSTAFRKATKALSTFYARTANTYSALSIAPPIRLPRVPEAERQAA